MSSVKLLKPNAGKNFEHHLSLTFYRMLKMNFEKNIYGTVLFTKVKVLFFKKNNIFLSEHFSKNDTIAFPCSKNLSNFWDFLMSKLFEKEIISESFQITPFLKVS